MMYVAPPLFAVGDMVNLQPTGVEQASAFNVVPQLPAGLTLCPYTGIISGCAIEVAAQEKYKVTAWSEFDECMTCEFSLEVETREQQAELFRNTSICATADDFPDESEVCDLQDDREDAPEPLAYSVDNVFAVGDNVNLEAAGAAQAVGFTVVPGLPAGLSLNPYTGTIDGCPKEATAEVFCKVTAWDETDGHMSCEVVIRIVPQSSQLGLNRRLSVLAVAGGHKRSGSQGSTACSCSDVEDSDNGEEVEQDASTER